MKSTPQTTQPSIELHIGELVLHGLALRDRHHIGEVVARELARLFAEQGMPPSLAQGGEVARLDGGSLNVAPDSKAEVIGVQVAQALYAGLSR